MERKSEYLVVGAGVVGLAIATSLADRGRSVVLVDQSEYGRGASGTNLGQISMSDREQGLEQTLVFETLDQYEKASPFYQLEFRQSGGICAFEKIEDERIAREIVEKKKKQGYRLELVTNERLGEIEPNLEKIRGGVYSPEEGQINPLRVNCWLYDRAVRAGVCYHPHTRVTGFVRHEGHLKGVATEQGDLLADQVILATGSWTRELMRTLELDYPVDYIRGSAVVTEPCPPVLHGIIEDGGYFTGNVPDGSAIYFGGVQEENGSVLIAQANRMVEDYDTGIHGGDLAAMVKLFLDHVPVLRDVQILRAWSGVTTLTEDEKPFWGHSGVYPNLFLAVGFKGAFSVAPAVGERTARWLCDGIAEEDYRAWSPVRING